VRRGAVRRYYGTGADSVHTLTDQDRPMNESPSMQIAGAVHKGAVGQEELNVV
jgi:hypothetical protein